MVAHSPSEQTGSARPFLPVKLTISNMREAAQACRGCDLYQHATQAVFGEGPRSAPLVIVGEQPGDYEDRQGRPFVGPAGRMLDLALEEIGIPRKKIYVTNVVKHFKFTMRAGRRLHGKPNDRQICACRPWLEAELAVIKPPMLVTLGATASQAMFGHAFRVSRQRGQVFGSKWAPWSMATVHPSSLLRVPDEEARHAAIEAFTEDLRIAAKQFQSVTAAQA